VFDGSAPENGTERGKTVYVARSSAAEGQWSEPRPALGVTWGFHRPALVQVPDGPILLAFGWLDPDGRPAAGRDAGFFVSHSSDNGATFSAARLIRTPQCGRVSTSGSAVALEDGSILLPLTADGAVRLAASRDNGETWTLGKPLAGDSSAGCGNPSLVRLQDRRLFCVFEGRGGATELMTCESADNGRTWGPPARTGIEGSRPSCAAASNGVLLCAFVDPWPAGLTLMRSYNGGVRWEDGEHVSDSRDGAGLTALDGGRVLALSCPRSGEDGGTVVEARMFDASAPEPPAGLSGSFRKDRGIHIRWNASDRTVYYIVYRDTVPMPDPAPGRRRLTTCVDGRFHDAAVDSGKTYFYRVTAVRSDNGPAAGSESEPSRELKIFCGSLKK
jgi:hypothetical protein